MRFICDVMLGKLTKYLRVLGFDTIFLKNLDVLETYKNLADPPLLFTKRTKTIPYRPSIFIQANEIQTQMKEIKEVIRPYIDHSAFMTRCIECNSFIESVESKDIEAHVPEYIYHHHKEFKMCPSCKKVYWEGTHTEQMKKWIEGLTSLK